MVYFRRGCRYRGDAMTPAEKKAVEAVVRAAKKWHSMDYNWNYEHTLNRAVARLLREEAKREKRRGK